MRNRASIGFLFVVLSFTAVCGCSTRVEPSQPRFEAHEFAVFRSQYDRLRSQAPAYRAEHFRDLLDAVETSRLTPGMAETLAEFCRGVARSPEEAASVQAEARLVARALEAKLNADPKLPVRAPASLEAKN